MSEIERLLRELIAIPSVNPAFVPVGAPFTGEKQIGDFIAGKARKAGLEVQRQPVLPGRSNVIARLLPRGKARHRLILAPHLDTVAADRKQFSPRMQGGRIYGRGACDTKGCVAVMFQAICDLARKGPLPPETEIVFAGLVDEENAQSGSREFARRGMQADLAIVGEPTRLQLVTAHKGSLWLTLKTKGKAAHGSRPELGRNAVHEMARIVVILETDYARKLRGRRHPLLGQATVSVGAISGGTQANIVPDACSILVDRRTLPGETEATVGRELQRLLGSRKLKASLDSSRNGDCEPLDTNPGLPWVRGFMGILGQSKPVGVNFFCDAAVLAQGGIPSVVFGPGDIAQAHTNNEWISTRSLNRAGEILSRFLRTLP